MGLFIIDKKQINKLNDETIFFPSQGHMSITSIYNSSMGCLS